MRCAQLAIEGITDETIPPVEIDKQPFNIQGRVMRTRALTVAPAALVLLA